MRKIMFVLHTYPEGKTWQRNVVWDLRSSSTQILSSPRGTALPLSNATFIWILHLIIRRNLMWPRKKQKIKYKPNNANARRGGVGVGEMFDSAAIVLPPHYATHPQVINNGLLVLCVCEPLSPAVSLVKGWKVRGRVEHQVEGWACKRVKYVRTGVEDEERTGVVTLSGRSDDILSSAGGGGGQKGVTLRSLFGVRLGSKSCVLSVWKKLAIALT
jgi:hypothetical protein